MSYNMQLDPTYRYLNKVIVDSKLEKNTIIVPSNYFVTYPSLADIIYAISVANGNGYFKMNNKSSLNFFKKNSEFFLKLLITNFNSSHLIILENGFNRYIGNKIKIHDKDYIIVSEDIMKKLKCKNKDLIQIYDILYKTNEKQYIKLIKENKEKLGINDLYFKIFSE